MARNAGIFTIISCAMAVTKVGAVPVLIDSDKKTYRYLIQNKICVKNLKNRKWIFPGGIEKADHK